MISHTEPGLNSQVIPSQLVTHPHPCPRPKPRPIFGESKGKKRKIADLSGDSDLQASGENKCNQNSQGSSLNNSKPIVAPMEDIQQALIAQHEPQPAAISSLCMCSLTSIQHLTQDLTDSFSPHSVVSHPILVVSHQTIGNTYLSPMHHWLWLRLRGLDARSPPSKWLYLLQYH